MFRGELMYASILTDQIDDNLETALQIARLYHYEYVELHTLLGKSIEQCSMKEVNYIKSLLKKYDMKVSCISSTIFLMCPLRDNYQLSQVHDTFKTIEGFVPSHLKHLKNACKIAKRLQCPRIRIFPFRFPDNCPAPFGTQDDITQIMRYIREAVKIAEAEEITLVLENCPYSHLPKGLMTIQIVKAIHSPYLKLLWDPGNSYRAMKDQIPEEYLIFSLLEELAYIYPWIDHIHIKDYRYEPSYEKPYQHVAFTNGDVDYERIFAYLRKHHYKNAVSLEAETDYNEVLESMDLLYRWVQLSQSS